MLGKWRASGPLDTGTASSGASERACVSHMLMMLTTAKLSEHRLAIKGVEHARHSGYLSPTLDIDENINALLNL